MPPYWMSARLPFTHSPTKFPQQLHLQQPGAHIHPSLSTGASLPFSMGLCPLTLPTHSAILSACMTSKSLWGQHLLDHLWAKRGWEPADEYGAPNVSVSHSSRYSDVGINLLLTLTVVHSLTHSDLNSLASMSLASW